MLVGVTKNGKHTSEQCCRFKLIDRENVSKIIFYVSPYSVQGGGGVFRDSLSFHHNSQSFSANSLKLGDVS